MSYTMSVFCQRNYIRYSICFVGQGFSVGRGWTVRRSNPGGGGARFSACVQTGPGTLPASCIMGTGSFPRVKVAGAWR